MGASGEVRGRTKFEVYERYQELMQDDSWDWHPRNKKDAKKLMVRDPDTEEWVLSYRALK